MRSLLILTFVPHLIVAVAGITDPDPLVKTTSGVIRGFIDTNTTSITLRKWLGIRYGEDTSGYNRWRPPVAVVPKYTTIFNATTYGPACLQGRCVPLR